MILSYVPGATKCSTPATTKTSPVDAREDGEPNSVWSLPLRCRPSHTRIPQTCHEVRQDLGRKRCSRRLRGSRGIGLRGGVVVRAKPDLPTIPFASREAW